MLKMTTSNLEHRVTIARQERDLSRNAVLEAAKSGNFDAIPALTAKWQEKETALKTAKEVFLQAWKG